VCFSTEVSARRDKVYRLNVIVPDIALLPVSGTYVMRADEVIKAARAINPKVNHAYAP